MDKYTERITEVCDKARETADPVKKAELHKEFWHLAIEAFNEEVAGDVILADGRVLTTPKIEL